MVRILAFAAACLLGSTGTLGQAVLKPGEFATVATGGTALVANNQTVAQLPEKSWFEVARTNGSWTAGYAVLDGERKSGWVLTAKLTPDSPQRQAEAAAAWEKQGAKLDKDPSGAVLAIDAADSQVGDAELAQVMAFPRLEELSLAGSKASGGGLAQLAGLPRLKRLFLDGLPLDDNSLKPLEHLRGLEGLSLANTKATDEGLAHLSGLTNLAVLNLSQTAITDDGLRHIAPLEKMETLALKGTKINGLGLIYVRRMLPLNVLNLSQCPIEGENLRNLHDMHNLRILHVADCNIPQKYVEELERHTTSLAVFD
jgi:hypothetical protein